VHYDTEDGPAGNRSGRAGDGEERPRALRRPAERTARRAADSAEEPSGPPITERISDWVTSLTGSRPEPQNGHTTEAEQAQPAAARSDRPRHGRTSEPAAAARTRRRTDSRATADRESASWMLRVAAIGLLALLMLALVVIVLTLL
jgi:hypothetical protein